SLIAFFIIVFEGVNPASVLITGLGLVVCTVGRSSVGFGSSGSTDQPLILHNTILIEGVVVAFYIVSGFLTSLTIGLEVEPGFAVIIIVRGSHVVFVDFQILPAGVCPTFVLIAQVVGSTVIGIGPTGYHTTILVEQISL